LPPDRTHRPPLRIVSLLPAATEIVCALGAEAELAGISHECDYPAGVAGRPVLTSSRIGHPGSKSNQIDYDVREVLKRALAVYTIDEAALAAARPDVIVTQDLCDVCAVSFDDVVEVARTLTNPEVRIVNLHPTRLADVWTDIRKVAAGIGREREAVALLARLEERVEDVRRRATRWLGRSASPPPNVLTLEWIDPAMVGGTWMPELVRIAGGQPLVTKPGDHAPTLSLDDLARLDPPPDVVIVKPCGFTIARTVQEADHLSALLAEMPWPAVRERRVWLADGNAYFNRPGPRIVDSLEILAACLHPNAFSDLAQRHAAGFRRFGVRHR
jgi:iron complex transport system substrate-binding protein